MRARKSNKHLLSCLRTASILFLTFHFSLLARQDFIFEVKFDIQDAPFHIYSTTTRTVRPIQKVGIFLNTWIPPKDLYVDKSWRRTEGVSLEIISERLHQISQSYAATQDMTVYVTVVGRDSVNQTRLERICQQASSKLDCVFSGFVENGGELDTLSHLHDFCRDHAEAKAIYIHNKGSFHPDPKNTKWRRAMTDAVTTEMCLQPQDDSCNACGLKFSSPPSMFTLLFPGNFFTASCRYINLLHNPYAYNQHMKTMLGDVKKRGRRGLFHFAEKGTRDWVLGANRYTPEHWIGSHPMIKPCDLALEDDYSYWQHVNHTKDDFQWSMIPRHPFNVTADFRNYPTIRDNPDLRLRSYMLLPGLLWRFMYLYNLTPPDTSWIYGRLQMVTFGEPWSRDTDMKLSTWSLQKISRGTRRYWKGTLKVDIRLSFGNCRR